MINKKLLEYSPLLIPIIAVGIIVWILFGKCYGYTISYDATYMGTIAEINLPAKDVKIVLLDLRFSDNVDATNGLDVTNANLTVGGANFSVAPSTGNLTTAGDIAVNGGDITSTSSLTLTPNAGSNLNIALSTTGDFAVNTNQLYVDTSTTNVGIGITAPSQALDIAVSAANLTFSHTTGPHQITTGGTTHLALMPGGNVGVGTTSPTAKLEVNGNLKAKMQTDTVGNVAVWGAGAEVRFLSLVMM